MIRSRGISERTVFAYNGLPKITEVDLLESAGLAELMPASKRSPFAYTWKYGTGLTAETVHLQPGDFLPLRESEAREFERCTNALEMGLCVVPAADLNAPETKRIVLAALQRAVKFYHDGGQKQLMDLRKRHSYSEEDMKEQRARFWPYHLNRAKELAITAHLQALKSAKASGKAA